MEGRPPEIPDPNPPDEDPNEPRPQRVWLVTGHPLQPGITVNISIIGDGVPKDLWCTFLEDLRKLRPGL